MQAGDNAVQINTDSGVVNVGNVPTIGEIRAIALDAAKSYFLDSISIARDLINARVEYITDEVIRRITEKNEALYARFPDPRFLGPLVSIQRNFAETGDRELGGILSGLLADLAGEPIRSRREIVLREAIECAPKLTTQHLNALTVIFRITRVSHYLAYDVEKLVSVLESELGPYFQAIPSDSFDYSYMGATQAGTYVPSLGSTIYSRIYGAHRNAMYEPFDVSEFATIFAAETIEEVQADVSEAGQMIEVPYELSEAGIQKLKLKTDNAIRILSVKQEVIQQLTSAENKFRIFVRDRSITEQQFETAIREQSPNLTQFLDQLQRTGALSFQLSPVGIMLARHEMESRSPETAAQLDVLFEESNPLT